MSSAVTFRCDIEPSDPSASAVVESTGVFSPMEVVIAVELADERLVKGPASGYHFIFAERDGQAVGYACYGPIALTQGSYDLYWIAVDRSARGAAWGGLLLDEAERRIRAEGGLRVYIETSTRPPYAHAGILRALRLSPRSRAQGFYAPGDGKAIYVKSL